MTDHDQNTIDALWPIMAATCVDDKLTWSGHARVILDAIRAGKVSGIVYAASLPLIRDEMTAMQAKLNALRAERDGALARVKEVEGERNRLREHHAFYQSIQNSQQSHQSLCERVADAAIRAGVVYNFGACGGGEPSFGAIVSKVEDAIANYSKLKADNDRLRGLLREISPIMRPLVRAMLSEGGCVPAAAIADFADRIDQELGQ